MIQKCSSRNAGKKIEEQLVKKHLDIIVLKALKTEALNGYAIISFIQNEFEVLLGPGRVYGLLESLEKRNLVKVSNGEKPKCYILTDQGKELLAVIADNRSKLRNIANNIF